MGCVAETHVGLIEESGECRARVTRIEGRLQRPLHLVKINNQEFSSPSPTELHWKGTV